MTASRRKRRSRRLVVLAMLAGASGAALCAALVVVLLRPGGSAAPASGRPPVPAPPARVSVGAPDLSEHRRLTARALEPGPPGTRFELRQAGAAIGVARADLTSGVISFGELPPDATLELVAVPPGSARPIALSTVRTPGALAVRSVVCCPGTTSVLVDFEPARAVACTVEIGLAREREPRQRAQHAAGDRGFRKLFTGLEPGTDHVLSIRPRGMWGGLWRARFRTFPAGRRAPIRTVLAQRRGPSLEMLTGDGELWREHDPDVLPLLSARLDDPAEVARMPLDRVLGVAQTFRSRELLDAVLPHAERSRDPDVVAALIITCTLLRHPAAVEVAERSFPEAKEAQLLDAAAGALAREGGKVACDRLAARAEALAGPVSGAYMSSMLTADHRAALDHFARWRASKSDRLADAGVRGGALSGDADALAAVVRVLVGPRTDPRWESAVRALAGVRTGAVRRVLGQELRRDPAAAALMWACVRQGLPEAIAPLEAALADSQPPSVRAQAALALGSLQATGAAAALRGLLWGIDPDVREAAAWAAGNLRDAAAAEGLAQLAASGADRRGVAAWALRQVSATQAVPALAARLAVLRTATGREEAAVAPLLALSLEALDPAHHRGALRGLASGAGASVAVRDAARLVEPAAPREPGDVELVVFPWVPCVRTGISLVPGDWVDVTASGVWCVDGVPLAASARVPREPGRDMRLAGLIDPAVFVLPRPDEAFRIVPETAGELVLSPLGQAQQLPSVRPSSLSGFARVVISRAAR